MNARTLNIMLAATDNTLLRDLELVNISKDVR